MVRAGSSPGEERHPTPLPVPSPWLLPAAAVVLTALIALAVVPASARWAVAWCGLVAALAVGALASETARRGRMLTALQRQQAADEYGLRSRLGRQEAQVMLLAEELLPQAVARVQRGDFIEDILKEAAPSEGTVTPEFQTASKAALRAVLEAVDAEEALRESAQRAFVNIARRVQAIVHRQAQDLRQMEDKHGEDPAVFDDLLRLDHGNALVGRLADSIAVLGGARPGRQWGKAVPLYSVLRGAMSRILDYQRVELHPVSEVAVTGPAVEPLIHALAELLDNATRYSPPHTRVHLTAVEVQSGIAVEIEDGGLSLSEEGRARAERMLQEAQAGIDVNDLGETPRLGLAVVGRLAHTYGFQVSLRPSAYGGVRAVLVVPQKLITSAPATGIAHGIGAASGPRRTGETHRPQAVRAQRGPTGPTGAAPAWAMAELSGTGSADTEYADGQALPQRRRRSLRPDPTGTLATAVQESATTAAEQRPAAEEAHAKESVQPGMWLAAFSSGVNGEPTGGRSRPGTGAAEETGPTDVGSTANRSTESGGTKSGSTESGGTGAADRGEH
jgi:signal transduction histidine kinase